MLMLLSFVSVASQHRSALLAKSRPTGVTPVTPGFQCCARLQEDNVYCYYYDYYDYYYYILRLLLLLVDDDLIMAMDKHNTGYYDDSSGKDPRGTGTPPKRLQT